MPVVTLFMLMSVDGKISTGKSDDRDFDKDLPYIDGVKEGLHQYYEIEKTTDAWSLCSGKTFEKIGINESSIEPKKDVNMVVIDNNYLTKQGVKNLLNSYEKVYIITTKQTHPAWDVEDWNLTVMYQPYYDYTSMFHKLECNYGCKAITVQTGETLNGIFLENYLFDYVDIVIAPILIGGKETPNLIGGKSIEDFEELESLQSLVLEEAHVLKNSYVRLRYKVNK